MAAQQNHPELSVLQQREAAQLLRAEQQLACLPDDYFPSNSFEGSAASSSTPQCRCHLRRTSLRQPASWPPQQWSSGEFDIDSISYSCSSLLSFNDSTDASFSAVDEDQRRLSRLRREQTQLNGLLVDLDERLLRLRRQGAEADQARLLLSLRRMSVEKLLSAVAKNADSQAKKVASLLELKNNPKSNSSDSDFDLSDDC